MIICTCRKVTSTMIDECITKGIFNYYGIQAETNCGKSCGSCAPNVIDYVYKKAGKAS